MQINRTEVISMIVTEMLENTDSDTRRAGYIHLYGVAQAAAAIAQKRGLNAELAQIAGLLHDYYAYKTGDRENHAVKGGDMILPMLAKTELFTICEMGTISKAVAAHSDKDKVGDPYEEVLKDADVIQHILSNVTLPVKDSYKARYEKPKEEFLK